MSKIGQFFYNFFLLTSIGAVAAGCKGAAESSCGATVATESPPIKILRGNFVTGADDFTENPAPELAVVTGSGVEIWKAGADSKLSRLWTINEPTSGVATSALIIESGSSLLDDSLLLGTETGFRQYVGENLLREYATPSKPIALSTVRIPGFASGLQNVVVTTEDETLIYLWGGSQTDLEPPFRNGVLTAPFRILGQTRSMAVQRDQLVVLTDREVLKIPVSSIARGQTATPTRSPLPSGRWWPIQDTDRELFVRYEINSCDVSVQTLAGQLRIQGRLRSCEEGVFTQFEDNVIYVGSSNNIARLNLRANSVRTFSIDTRNVRVVDVTSAAANEELWFLDALSKTIGTVCAGPEPDAGVSDAGPIDSGMDSSVNTDAASSDAGVDSGNGDASPMDSSIVDSGIVTDSATTDAGADSSMPCTGALLASPTSTIPLRIDNTDVAAGDLNGDGRLDAVVTARQNNQVSVLLGNGDGSFQTRVDYATGQNPLGVALGDLNNDGFLDVVTAQSVTDGGSVGVRLGSANGTLQARTDFNAGTGTNAVAIADLNGDGNADVLATNSGTDNLSVFLGNGTGSLAAPLNAAAGDRPIAVQTGLFNGDDTLDVLVVNAGSNDVRLFMGAGDGTFAVMVNYAIEPGATDLSLGDLNGDGFLDVAVAHSTGAVNPSVLSILLGNGNGTLQAHTTLATARFPSGVQIADVNLDGRQDIVVGGGGEGVIGVHLGSSTGGFQALQAFGAGGSSSGPGPLAVGNFNAGTRPDVFVLLTSEDQAAVLLSVCP